MSAAVTMVDHSADIHVGPLTLGGILVRLHRTDVLA